MGAGFDAAADTQTVFEQLSMALLVQTIVTIGALLRSGILRVSRGDFLLTDDHADVLTGLMCVPFVLSCATSFLSFSVRLFLFFLF